MKEKKGFNPLEIRRNGESGQAGEWAGGEVGKKHTFSLSHFLICKGLTLIEILVVLFIMGFIATALYHILNVGMKGWRAGKEKTDIIAQAMDRLTRELREATYMKAAGETGINFSAYLGTTSSKEISYYYNSSQDILYRNEDSGGGREIAKYMNSFSLYYYSKGDDGAIHSFDPSAETDDIWMIEIKSKVKKDDNIVNLRSTVQPRNYSEYHEW